MSQTVAHPSTTLKGLQAMPADGANRDGHLDQEPVLEEPDV